MKVSRLQRITRSKIFQLVVIAAIIVVITTIIKPGSYNKPNIRQILNTVTINALFVCGVAPLLMAGGIDWAGSAIGTGSLMVFAALLAKFPSVPWGVMLIPMMLTGAIIGFVNSLFIIRLKLVAFIATMAMSTVLGGFTTWANKGVSIQITNKSFTNLSATFLFDTIPVFFIFALIMCFLYSQLLIRTTFGRSIMMVGGNQVAARLAGLNPDKIRTILYINSGVIASLGGMIWGAQNRMSTATALSTTTPHMAAFLGSMLGGVSFWGGAGSLAGGVVGVALVQLLSYSLQMMSVPTWVFGLINGSLLIVALTIDDVSRRLRLRKLGVKDGVKGAVMPGM